MFLKNLNALNSQNPNLAKKLNEFSLEDAQKIVSVLQAQSGDLVIAYDSEPLDDMVNPLEKSRNIWDTLVKNQLEKNDIVLVFGLGLGYLFKRAYVNTNSRIVVYEPKIEVLRFVLEYVDFSEQIKDKRIYITDNESDCVEYLSEKYISNDKIEIVYSDIYLNLFSDNLLFLSKKIIQLCESKKADVLTIQKLSKNWILNNIENVQYMANSRPLSLLKDMCIGKTALILGAGPSLKSNLDSIRPNRDKYIIFAVNKVFDYVVDNGVEPDFLVAADARWIDYTIRVRPDVFEKTNLISTTKAHSFTYKQNFHSIFNYYLKNDSFYEELNSKFPEEITLYETEGTAISQCYYSALEMGFLKIIFCGLDLAIKQNEAYAPDIQVEVRTDGSATFSREIKKIVEIKSVTGEMVQTRDDYAMFVSQLESAFAKNKTAKLYNSSDFGAYIEGMIYEPFVDSIKHIAPVGIDMNAKIEELYLKSEDRWQQIYNAQLEILKSQQDNVCKISSSVEDWLGKNRKVIESIGKNNINRQTVENLNRIKSEELSIIKNVLNNVILGSYFQFEILEYSKLNNENSDLIAARQYSLRLFDQVVKAASILLAACGL